MQSEKNFGDDNRSACHTPKNNEDSSSNCMVTSIGLSSQKILTHGGVVRNLTKASDSKIQSTITKDRFDVIKWNGWGYNDSKFVIEDGKAKFTGKRYPIGELELPYLLPWAKDTIKFDTETRVPPQDLPKPEMFPEPNILPDVLKKIEQLGVTFSTNGIDRLVRAHGQTLNDVYRLRCGPLPRVPDIVVWPDCHDTVERLVQLACSENIVIIPYGGGTSVSGAVTTPEHEMRTIMALDTSLMNRLLWVDKENLIACCEAGIVGQDLEKALYNHGLTTGHEPDSYEFSSVGGWVATRASGMKKNVYGNIEDLLVQAKMVCPQGVLQKGVSQVPRTSIGPDFNHVILGSEGTLGVITEVVLKVRPVPPCRKYGSIVFPNFESGLKCMREVARQRCQPASIRLMDNEQFKFGLALRSAPSFLGHFLETLKQAYLTRIKGFNWNTLCVTTLLFEGTKESVASQESHIYGIASQFGGIQAGTKNGERGYILTFVVAYVRDLALEYCIVAESFETSVPWDKTLMLCRNVKHVIHAECDALGLKHRLVSCRVTQTYDVGCCVYFYFGFNWAGHSDPVHIFETIEERARDEIIACGGSLSHHHGVGKVRARWYPSQVSPLGVALYQATKQKLDPKNIFATGNLLRTKL